MLSAQAHTLRQKARLAVSLAMVGGFVDAVGFLIVGSFISNMTGNTALLGARLAETNWANAIFCFLLVAMFVVGATLSGVITEGGRRRGYQSVYALALAVEGLLLAGFLVILTVHLDASPFLLGGILSMAMGLQNATITQIAGAVVRTTHVTGVLTDLGIEGVQFLYWFRDRTRGRLWLRLRRAFRLSPRHPSVQRLFLLISIWGSFTAGVVLGALTWHHWQSLALLLPIGFLCFMILLDALRPIAVVRRLERHRHHADLHQFGIDATALPAGVTVYHVEQNGHSPAQRAPELSHLHRQLRRDTRVMLLLLPSDLRLEENSLLGLQHSCEEIRRRRRSLVVCAPQGDLFVRLRDGSIADVLGKANICPDAEFAVARCMELVARR